MCILFLLNLLFFRKMSSWNFNLIEFFTELMILFFKLSTFFFQLSVDGRYFFHYINLRLINLKYSIDIFYFLFGKFMLLDVSALWCYKFLSLLNHHFKRVLQIGEFNLQLLMLIIYSIHFAVYYFWFLICLFTSLLRALKFLFA